MVNRCKRLITVVTDKQAKVADRLEPKWHCGGSRVYCVPWRGQSTPPAKRANLTLSVAYDEHGKPSALPKGRNPQGEPMGLWVKDKGKSECHIVMMRIGIALRNEQHYPTRKRADFPLVSHHEIV